MFPEESQEQTPVEEQATSEAAPAPEDGTRGESGGNWEKRYNDLRPEFDRLKTELSELGSIDEVRQAIEFRDQLQSDPEVQQALYQQLQELYGEELDEDVEDTSGLPPEVVEYLQGLEQRFGEVEQRTQAQQEEAQLAQMDEHVSGTLEGLKEQEGLDLSDQEELWIIARATTLDPTPEGMPNVEQAFEEFKALDGERHQRYLKTKKAPSAPKGQTSSEQLDMSDDRVRREHMAEMYEAMEQD